MSLKEWAKEQFSKERMIRYMDGCNPVWTRSFVQLITWKTYPHIWSVVHVTTPDKKRSTYYLKVNFSNSQHDFAAAEVIMRSVKSGSEGPVTSVIHFSEKENAPKKLNKEIRRLRGILNI